METATAAPRSHLVVAYLAAAVALVFAAVSFYWAAGGMAGIDTLVGTIEEQARARDPGLIRLTRAAGGLEVAGAALALPGAALGPALPRRALLVNSVGVTPMWFGRTENTQGFSASELRWRMLRWEPWFLVYTRLRRTSRQNPPC